MNQRGTAKGQHQKQREVHGRLKTITQMLESVQAREMLRFFLLCQHNLYELQVPQIKTPSVDGKYMKATKIEAPNKLTVNAESRHKLIREFHCCTYLRLQRMFLAFSYAKKSKQTDMVSLKIRTHVQCTYLFSMLRMNSSIF